MNTLRTVLFVSCWAFTGGTVASLMMSTLWWVGALLAGIGAYLSENLTEVRAGFHYAWEKAVSWKPNTQWWRTFAILVAHAAHVGLGVGVFVTCFIVFLFGAESQSTLSILEDGGLACLFVGVFFFVMLCAPLLYVKDPPDEKRKLMQLIRRCSFYLGLTAPVALLYGIYTVLPFLKKQFIPFISAVGVIFGSTLFFIHSDRRMIWGLSSATGAAAMYLIALPAVLIAPVLAIGMEQFGVRVLRVSYAKC